MCPHADCFLSLSLSLCFSLSVCLSVSLCFSLSVSLFLSVCLSLCFSLFLSVCLSVSLCFSLSVSLFLSLFSISLYVYSVYDLYNNNNNNSWALFSCSFMLNQAAWLPDSWPVVILLETFWANPVVKVTVLYVSFVAYRRVDSSAYRIQLCSMQSKYGLK